VLAMPPRAVQARMHDKRARAPTEKIIGKKETTMPPLMQDASVARVTQQGPCCPVCQHDTQLLYDSPSMEGPTILQDAMCPACGVRWRDVSGATVWAQGVFALGATASAQGLKALPLSSYVLYAPDDVVPASGYVMHTLMVSRTDDTCPVDGTQGGQRHAPQT